MPSEKTNPPAIDEKAREAMLVQSRVIDYLRMCFPDPAKLPNWMEKETLRILSSPPPPPEGARPEPCRICGNLPDDLKGICSRCGPPKPDRSWVPLGELREGAIFETREGARAVKSEYHYSNAGAIKCVLIESGEYAHFCQGGLFNDRERARKHNATMVREIVLPDVTDTGKEKEPKPIPWPEDLTTLVGKMCKVYCPAWCVHQVGIVTDTTGCSVTIGGDYSIYSCKLLSIEDPAPQPVTSEGKVARGKEWLPEGMGEAYRREAWSNDSVYLRDSQWRTHYEALEREMAELRGKK